MAYEANEALHLTGDSAETALVRAVRDGTRAAEAWSRIAGMLGDLQSAGAIPALLERGEASAHLRSYAI